MNNVRDLTKYKKTLRKLKITHREVAEYTGHSRENITCWLNGRNPPSRTAVHVSGEIDELIEKKIKLLKCKKSKPEKIFK